MSKDRAAFWGVARTICCLSSPSCRTAKFCPQAGGTAFAELGGDVGCVLCGFRVFFFCMIWGNPCSPRCWITSPQCPRTRIHPHSLDLPWLSWTHLCPSEDSFALQSQYMEMQHKTQALSTSLILFSSTGVILYASHNQISLGLSVTRRPPSPLPGSRDL